MFKRNKYHILTYTAMALLFIASLVWAAQTDIIGSLKITASGDSETYQLSVYNSSGTREFSVDSSGNVYVAGTLTASTPALTTPDISYGVTAHAISATETWTMTAAEEKTSLLVITSGSAGTTTVSIYPSGITTCTNGRVYWIRNASNNSVVIKRSGGTGVTVASSKTAGVFCYSNDFYRLSADATH